MGEADKPSLADRPKEGKKKNRSKEQKQAKKKRKRDVEPEAKGTQTKKSKVEQNKGDTSKKNGSVSKPSDTIEAPPKQGTAKSSEAKSGKSSSKVATGKQNETSKKRKPEKGAKSSVAASKEKGKRMSKKETSGGDAQVNEDAWSKSKKKRMRKLRSNMMKKESEGSEKAPSDGQDDGKKNSPGQPKKESAAAKETETETEAKAQVDVKPVSKKAPSKLQQSYAARLSGSRFRVLNEELYTAPSSTSYEKFQSNPELFDQYHEGFRHQVESWPENPVQVIFQWLQKKYANSPKPTVVADFGCGDAELAKRLLEENGTTFQVHSFDLVAPSDLVTACDMAHVPLNKKSVDVAIFCLALMGTNVADFLLEAHRVLKDDGTVKIAEVRSRFSSSGKENLDDFVGQLAKLGFDCRNIDRSNQMFFLMELKKNGKTPDKTVDVVIKPCIYKRR